MLSKKRTIEALDVIADMFPDAEAELNYSNSFELTIAVLLSAQATDIMVNRVTDTLFKKYIPLIQRKLLAFKRNPFTLSIKQNTVYKIPEKRPYHIN